MFFLTRYYLRIIRAFAVTTDICSSLVVESAVNLVNY